MHLPQALPFAPETVTAATIFIVNRSGGLPLVAIAHQAGKAGRRKFIDSLPFATMKPRIDVMRNGLVSQMAATTITDLDFAARPIGPAFRRIVTKTKTKRC